MLTNYTERKKEVLYQYELFNEKIGEFEKIIVNAGLPSPMVQFKASLDDARRKSESIRANRFKLMIAGEAKSGKSTFINAYLGVELLPMDVKQCTSSIVEIKYGKEFRLVATYADNNKRTFEGESNIKQFLKENAALDDNYRDIPVPTINHDLLVRYGKKAQNEDIFIPKNEIEAFLSAPEIKKANIHNIDNYNKKIQNYINTKKDKWRYIVTKIELLFPFEDEALKGIEIIDSPGVCARGGVSEITSQYIENADAIIFLKPISGQALESSQFSEFMKNASVERNKNALFLVLTRIMDLTPDELQKQKDEAYKQFSILDKRNILFVDSKVELRYKQFVSCESLKEVQDIMIELNHRKDKDSFLDTALETSRKDMFSMPDKNLFVKSLKTMSNFLTVHEALSMFGRKAHYIALSSLLEVIIKVYARIIGDLNGHIERFKEKAEDPTELAKKIGLIKNELEKINEKMGSGLDNIASKYTGEEGEIKKIAENEAENFRKAINSIVPNDNAFDCLRNEALRMITLYKTKQDEIQHNIIKEFNNELIKIGNDSEIPFTSLEPDFSETEFDKIKLETKDSKAAKTEHNTGFFSPKTEYKYSRIKHYEVVKEKTLPRVDGIKSDLISDLTKFVRNIRSLYLQKLSSNANAKKDELDAIQKAKLNAEQIKKLIVELNKYSNNCETASNDAKRIKGGINNYVQQNART